MVDSVTLDQLWEDHREFFAAWEEALSETRDLVDALSRAAEQGEPLHELAARYHEAVKASDAAGEAFRKNYEKIKEAENGK